MSRLNIQGDVRRRLQEHFKGFTVAVSVPEKRKFPLVVVRRTGGAQYFIRLNMYTDDK